MAAKNGDSFKSRGDDGDMALNRRQCPHCVLWFRFDEAKPSANNKVRCPNCDWEMESDK